VLRQRIRSWYTGRWWVGCYIWYSEDGPGRAAAPPSFLLAAPNVTAHPSTASVPITVLLYDGPFLCGFNMAIKELIRSRIQTPQLLMLIRHKRRISGSWVRWKVVCLVLTLHHRKKNRSPNRNNRVFRPFVIPTRRPHYRVSNTSLLLLHRSHTVDVLQQQQQQAIGWCVLPPDCYAGISFRPTYRCDTLPQFHVFFMPKCGTTAPKPSNFGILSINLPLGRIGI